MIGLSDTPTSRLVDSPSRASLLHRTRPFFLSFLDTRPLPHPHVLYTLSLSLPSPASYAHPPSPALSRLIHTLTLALLSHIVHTPALSRALASCTHSHSRSTLSHHLYTLFSRSSLPHHTHTRPLPRSRVLYALAATYATSLRRASFSYPFSFSAFYSCLCA